MRILVVDNDEQILDVMTKILRVMGHTAIALQNSHHAHEDIVCAQPPFDAVILDRDLGTGRPTGKDVARGLMKGRCRDIPIAFASGDDMDDLRLEFPQAFFIQKPYGKPELEEFLAQVEKRNRPPLI